LDFELNFLRDRSFELLFVSTFTFLRIFFLHSHPNQPAVISDLEENCNFNTFDREMSEVFSSPPFHHGLGG